ncbi:MAG: hypothetical protein ACXWQ5_00995 [Ktedonobacterales bacterium]
MPAKITVHMVTATNSKKACDMAQVFSPIMEKLAVRFFADYNETFRASTEKTRDHVLLNNQLAAAAFYGECGDYLTKVELNLVTVMDAFKWIYAYMNTYLARNADRIDIKLPGHARDAVSYIIGVMVELERIDRGS